jgi:DNA-binding transcriptional LysR family regulator
LPVDDVQLLIRAAIDGVGLTLLMEEQAGAYLANGRLVPMLEGWCEPLAGYFLYYPSRRQQPAALSAPIDTLRLDGDRRKRSSDPKISGPSTLIKDHLAGGASRLAALLLP